MTLTRRSFLGILAALPLVGAAVRKAEPHVIFEDGDDGPAQIIDAIRIPIDATGGRTITTPFYPWTERSTTIELRAHNPEEQHMADLLAKEINAHEDRVRRDLMTDLFADG